MSLTHNPRNTNIVAAFLILNQNHRLLLSQRKNTGYQDGMFGLISGHVEKGETFTQAIIREAYEEAGVILRQHDLSVRHVMHRKSELDQSERVDVYFWATTWTGNVDNKEPDKCECLTWFDDHNLPQHLVPSVNHAIQQITQGIVYSEYGW